MEGGYHFIEHTADVGIAIVSPTMEGIFELAGEALFKLIAPESIREALTPFTLKSEGSEPENLLVNFLNDLLLHFETEGLLFRRLRVSLPDAGRLVADALCEPLDPERASVSAVVKAATHHNLVMRQKDGVFRAEVYLDL